MTINEYQKLALRTASGIKSGDDKNKMLLNGILGMTGEAGEAADLLKKHLFQGHEFDREHMAKELGDVAWYIALASYALGYDLEDIFKMNIEKLSKRYPDLIFDEEHSKHRAEGDV